MIDVENFITNEMINEIILEKNAQEININHIEKELKSKLYGKAMLKNEKKEITELINNFLDNYNKITEKQKKNIRNNLESELAEIQKNFIEKLKTLAEEFNLSKDFSIFNKDFKFDYYNRTSKLTNKREEDYDKYSISFENNLITLICSNNKNTILEESNHEKSLNSLKRDNKYKTYIEYNHKENNLFKKIAFWDNSSQKCYESIKEEFLRLLILDNIEQMEKYLKMVKTIRDLHYDNFVESKHKINIKSKIESITKNKKFNIKSLENEINNLLDIIELTEDLSLNKIEIDDNITNLNIKEKSHVNKKI